MTQYGEARIVGWQTSMSTVPCRPTLKPAEKAGLSRPKRLAIIVSEAIAELIDSGEFSIGSRLPPERELMKRFGVSRTAVRESITALAARGLLRLRPGHRPVVQRPDYTAALAIIGELVPRLIDEETGARTLFETRIFMEAALARNAALRATAEDLVRLDQALEANRSAIGDPVRFYSTDTEFHRVLYEVPRNPIYPAIHQSFVHWLTDHWRAMPRSAEIDRMNYVAHESIQRAIARRDADRAEEVLRAHLGAAWEFVRLTFHK